MNLYVATSNPGKLHDLQHAAQQTHTAGVTLQPLPGLDRITPPDEDGETFEANARLKAVYYSLQAPGFWVLADDSGLEVDALEGRPGVRSARFAADLGALDPERPVDQSNNDALLLAMLEQTDRAARYRCVLALAVDGRVLLTTQGTVEGSILSEPEGDDGFGYDPLFWIDSERCSMAQISGKARLRISHRGQALRKMLTQMQEVQQPG